MGNFQPEKAALASPALASIVPFDDIAAWLDRLLEALTNDRGSPGIPEEIRIHLGRTPFGEVLSAIQRARPGPDRPTEIALYRQWIDANNAISPLLYAAWFNIGVLFAQEGDHANAIVAYGNALTLRPDLHVAAINLGLALEADGRPDQALATWQRATQPDEVRVALEIQQARVLERLGRFKDAERLLYRVLLTDPAQPDVVHHLIYNRQRTCLWPVACSTIPAISTADLVRNSSPLSILALTDDIDLQRDAAAAWIARKTEPAPLKFAPVKPWPHERIRIGYLSSDFCSHAMSYLITELFERHDRDRFEVFGYCSSQDDGTRLRQRVLAAFDRCRLIRTLSDDQAAQTIRDDEIDVLIELNGITEGTRLPVLRWRPAPVQATYLGFIGPVPLPELDYLLCDDVVIPAEHIASYRPAPLAIGRIYQANDSKRTVGPRISRAEAGLPEDRFIFCCFSRHYKITEEMFGAWMSILRRTPRSVLWLARDNAYSQSNLVAAAELGGVAAERLIFSERADPDLYLSRLGLADLFLDTFPYNAGTIASDAIRMRLPLITLCGRAFASRMAASLLHAVNAPHGIASTLSKYVELAVRLANDPACYARYRDLFSAEAWRGTIGDIGRFTREFEDTWCETVRALREM